MIYTLMSEQKAGRGRGLTHTKEAARVEYLFVTNGLL